MENVRENRDKSFDSTGQKFKLKRRNRTGLMEKRWVCRKFGSNLPSERVSFDSSRADELRAAFSTAKLSRISRDHSLIFHWNQEGRERLFSVLLVILFRCGLGVALWREKSQRFIVLPPCPTIYFFFSRTKFFIVFWDNVCFSVLLKIGN